MTIQTQIIKCMLNEDYTESAICLQELKSSTIKEGVFMFGASLMISIVIVGVVLFLHSKRREKKELNDMRHALNEQKTI
jgi:hypothetical protein